MKYFCNNVLSLKMLYVHTKIFTGMLTIKLM